MKHVWMSVWVLSMGCGDLLYVRELPVADTILETVAVDLGQADRLSYYAIAGLYAEHVVAVPLGTGVQYTDLANRPEAVDTLGVALGQLAGVDPLVLRSRDEQLAYWVNQYNLTALASVVEARALDPGFRSVSEDDFAVFRTPSVRVGDDLMSLDLVENGVLRGDPAALEAAGLVPDDPLRARIEAWHAGVWEGSVPDARLHMVLNCASKGCPDLQAAPLRADTLEAVLDQAARAFVADAVKGAGPDGISELFDWFEPDFTPGWGSVTDFVSAHRDDGGAGVAFDERLTYDWSLNEATP